MVACLTFVGCQRDSTLPTSLIHSEALAASQSGSRDDSTTQFVQLPTADTGIAFNHQWDPSDKHVVDIDNAMVAGGVSIADYDGDGWADVFLTRPFGGCRLYRNHGGFRFQDVTKTAFADDLDQIALWSGGSTFVDVDNDGHLDLYVCGYDCHNRLFVNQGDGTFREQAQSYGLDFRGASIMMSFADYDRDGDMDAYLLTNHDRANEGAIDYKIEQRDGQPFVPPHLQHRIQLFPGKNKTHVIITPGQRDYLYRNEGDGSFVDVSREAGIEGYHMGLSATWWDYNLDGLPDLYVANDFHGPDLLYRNNGDGTFTDVAQQTLPYTPWYSMGSDVADINNDGLLDFLASDMSPTTHYQQKLAMGDMEENGWFLEMAEPRQYMRNTLYLNTGADRFMETAYMTGLDSTDWTWTVKFADLDNDGREDLFVTNGMTRNWFNSDLNKKETGNPQQDIERVWLKAPVLQQANRAYQNLGDLRFQEVGETWGLNHVGVTFGAALGDLDGDGDLDLVTNNFDAPAAVYRNDNDSGHRLLVRLNGTSSNRYGIGAILRVQTENGILMRYLTHSRGFMSSDDPRVHFGLGDCATIQKLTVEWPSGHLQQFENLSADRIYTITEPSVTSSTDKNRDRQPHLFAVAEIFQQVKHSEIPFNDFERQPLLPNKLSQLGPGMAWGDVDGDDDEDLYVSGAAGSAGTLLICKDNGEFQPSDQPDLATENATQVEEMAPLLFDADSDGDLDLYIVSGGVECEPGSEVLRDRLYWNDGHGNFQQASENTIPALYDSGSVAVAADFDRDGDLDLFVGCRSIPGKYPLAGASRLLLNDQGRFTDVTDQLAPGLKQAGLVTAAVWTDADNDGWLDLMVTYEWGPVRLWNNHQGELVDGTHKAGLAKRLGWWNSIATGDLDHDGDIDYVVTNYGLNTKYHPTSEQPVLAYYGHFDDSGNPRLIEAKHEGEQIFPVRGKSCSTAAMPFLQETFPTFHEFAVASLNDIYTPQCLAEANRFEVNTLESGVLLNNGKGQFQFQPLPRLAQTAPGFGIVVCEVNGDGHADIYLAQNFFTPQRETGRMSGGVSVLLTGRGDGSFQTVWPHRSGLVVPTDAKSLTTTDLNQDGWPDFVVGNNDSKLTVFQHQGIPEAQRLKIRLEGRPGNTMAVGSRIIVMLDDNTSQSAEVHAGSGYLSQSTSTQTFGWRGEVHVRQIEVRWPDGQTTSHKPSKDNRLIVLSQPSLP